MESRKQIIDKLKEIRKEKKISQTYLAEIMGVTQPFIAKIEKGEEPVGLDIIIKFAQALGYELTFKRIKK